MVDSIDVVKVIDIQGFENYKFCFLCRNYFKFIGYIKGIYDKIYLCTKCVLKEELPITLAQNRIITTTEAFTTLKITCKNQCLGCKFFSSFTLINSHECECNITYYLNNNFNNDLYKYSDGIKPSMNNGKILSDRLEYHINNGFAKKEFELNGKFLYEKNLDLNHSRNVIMEISDLQKYKNNYRDDYHFELVKHNENVFKRIKNLKNVENSGYDNLKKLIEFQQEQINKLEEKEENDKNHILQLLNELKLEYNKTEEKVAEKIKKIHLDYDISH